MLPKNRWRFLVVACYWLSPAAILISAYHGNTDTAIAFFVLLAIWLATKNRTISSGVAFTFPAGRTMAPNSYLVIAANLTSFQVAYPSVTNVIGNWTGTLSNSGENIKLTDAQGNVLVAPSDPV